MPAASGNPTPTYAASGEPAGISFSTATRVLSGTPTGTGSGTITITATNSEGSDTWTVDYVTAAAAAALVLTDFNTAGLEVETLFLIEATSDVSGSGFNTLYTASGEGTLIDGAVTMGTPPTVADITRLRYRASNTRINFLVATGLDLQTYFGAGGDGADLDLTVQTVDGAHTWRPVIEGNTTIEANINFDAPAEARTLIEAINIGDRFIIAFTRPASVTPPTVTNIHLGTDAITKVYAGATELSRVYLGAARLFGD